jgi:type II secretory pathway pseudopilin PulG
MKQFQPQAGYTIVEVMIFLVISAGLFGAAVTGLTLQNNRTQFTESVQTFDQRLQDVLNDVETGYLPSNENFTCTLDGSGAPHIDNTSGNPLGTNLDCVFVGKAIQFAPSGGTASDFRVYTLVGRRVMPNAQGINVQVESIDDAFPRAIDGVNGGVVDTGRLTADLEIYKVVYKGATDSSPNGGFAILSGFGQADLSDGFLGLQSGTTKVSLSGIQGTSLAENTSDFTVNKVQHITTADMASVSKGVVICIKEGGNGRKASIVVGGQGQRTATNVGLDDQVVPECIS